jgi:hypothetical protein
MATIGRELVGHLLRGLYLAGDTLVRRKVHDHLMEMNSTRVQSDVVNRVQESGGQLEVEIRKLLNEVSRIAERALDHARTARSQGASAVEAAMVRLDAVERSIRRLQMQRKTDTAERNA